MRMIWVGRTEQVYTLAASTLTLTNKVSPVRRLSYRKMPTTWHSYLREISHNMAILVLMIYFEVNAVHVMQSLINYSLSICGHM